VKTLPFLERPEWLLSFDFDGTLAHPDEEPSVQFEFFEVIESLRHTHRVYWGINTGRSLMFALQGMAEADFPYLPDYIIAREREIFTPNGFGRWIPEKRWNERSAKAHRKLFRKYRKFLKRSQQWVESETGAVWGMQEDEPAGIVASTVSEMDWIVRRLNEELTQYPGLSYQRNGIYLRFSHQDYHKGSAMAEVAKLIGVDAAHTFAIGDSDNDLDMLNPELARYLACPSNACAEVRERVRHSGGYIAKNPTSRGTVEALQSVFPL
jgi:HAD superfamily hydrolase (TIGR01484 family)